MSDESSPPQLRLRPRNRDAEAAPVASIASLSLPPDTGSENPDTDKNTQIAEPTPGRFRLKPHSLQTTSASFTAAPTSTDPALQLEASVVPALAQAEPSEPARLKLKTVQPVSLVTDAEPLIVEELAADMVDASLSVPQLVAIAQATTLVATDSAARPVVPAAETAKAGQHKAPSAAGRSRWRMSVIALVVLVGGAIYGGLCYWYFREDTPPPAPVVRKSVAEHIPKPVAAVAVAEPTAVVVPAELPPAVPSVAVTVPEEKLPPPPEVSAVATLAPLPAVVQAVVVPSVTVVKPPAAAVVTPAFRLWVEAVRINGVAANASGPPRVIINGRLVRPGDTIDIVEGIVYDSLDTERKVVLFRDRKGAIASKPY